MDHTLVLLQVKNLHTVFHSEHGDVQAVRGVSFQVNKGETLGIIGESGCGKSATAMSVCCMLAKNGEITDGKILLHGENLRKKSAKEIRNLRAKAISTIFQDSLTSLDPLMPIGKQIAEVVRYHERVTWKDAEKKALEMLARVGFQKPEVQMKAYPHELSGGMRQRVTIAMALACKPELLIADEPTTALDVTIQAQILEVLKELQGELGTSIILIFHDIGVVANCCQRIQVMYGGVIVESARTENLIQHPLHPYTQGLLSIVSNLTEGESEYLPSIEGAPPQLVSPPSGCPFAERCGYAMKICTISMPEFNGDKEHMVRCWRYDERNPKKVRCDS